MSWSPCRTPPHPPLGPGRRSSPSDERQAPERTVGAVPYRRPQPFEGKRVGTGQNLEKE